MTTQVFDDLSDVTFRGYQYMDEYWDLDDETQERLDDTYVEKGQCDSKGPPNEDGKSYYCTRKQGHSGPHVAHAYDLILDKTVACGIWD